MNKLPIIAILALLVGLMAALPGVALAVTDCTFTTVDTTMTLDADCTTDTTILVPDGFTLDGDGFSITAVDPAGGHFLGAVVANAGTTAHVKNLTVTASGLINACDVGADRLRGIMFNGASGSITDNTVLNINQGVSGCQEGNGIEVRNAPFDGTHPNTIYVEISDNTVTNYQKTGILANGDVFVEIKENVVTGVVSAVIAQNGIQLGFGGQGVVKENEIGPDFFTGSFWAASAILLFEVSDVVVNENLVKESQLGVAIAGFGGVFGGPGVANYNIVKENTLIDNKFGMSLQVFFGAGGQVNNNVIEENQITATGSVTNGIDLFGCVPVSGFCPAGAHTVDNNLIKENFVSGYLVGLELNQNANNNTMEENDFSGNTTPVIDGGTGNVFAAFNLSAPTSAVVQPIN